MNSSITFSRLAGFTIAAAIALSIHASVLGADPPPTAPRGCVDMRTVAVTEQRQQMPNGKGAAQVVKKTKQVCHSCAVPSTVMKPSLPNGRGAMTRVAVSAEHDCTDCAR